MFAGASTSSCQTGTCNDNKKRSKRKSAYERVSEKATERERQAEAQRLEQLIEGRVEGIELEGLSDSEDGEGPGRSEL